jgi:hypothetical protein
LHGCDVVAVIVAVAGRVVVAMWLQLGGGGCGGG